MYVQAKLKKSYFNSAKVLALLGKKTSRMLFKAGGFARTFAQRSMRTKKGASPAGSPPHSHGNKLLRKLLYFHVDAKAKVVRVGPLKKVSTASFKVPRLHEKGGTVNGKRGTGHYPARPYMEPALEATKPKLAKWYADG
jgi:hypothetical protein